MGDYRIIEHPLKIMFVMEAYDPFQHSFLRGVLVEGLAQHGIPSLILRLAGMNAPGSSIRHWRRCCVVVLSRFRLNRLPAFIREEIFNALVLCIAAVRLLRRSEATHVVVRNVWQVAAVLVLFRSWHKKPVCYQDAFFNEELTVLSIGRNRRLSVREMSKVTYHKIRIIIKHWCVRRCDNVFVMSKEMKRYYVDRHVAEQKITIMPMGILPSMMGKVAPASPAVLDLPPGRFVLVYVGCLDQARSPEIMIDAFERAWALDNRLFLLIIGGEAKDLQRLAGLRPIIHDRSRYRMTGHVPFDTVFPMLRCAHAGLSIVPPFDVYLVASVTKLIEMLACGLPVIANCEIPEQAELIRDTGALLSCTFNVESISLAILRAVELGPVLGRMGTSGHEYAMRERSYDRLTERFLGAVLNESS